MILRKRSAWRKPGGFLALMLMTYSQPPNVEAREAWDWDLLHEIRNCPLGENSVAKINNQLEDPGIDGIVFRAGGLRLAFVHRFGRLFGLVLPGWELHQRGISPNVRHA